MGRMHSKGKGLSSSALPYKRTPPSWLKITETEVSTNLTRLRTPQSLHSPIAFCVLKHPAVSVRTPSSWLMLIETEVSTALFTCVLQPANTQCIHSPTAG